MPDLQAAQEAERYRVNLKAELEVRHLNAKFDLLLTHQWQRLLEIQQIQMEIMEEVTQKGGRRSPQKLTGDAAKPEDSATADSGGEP